MPSLLLQNRPATLWLPEQASTLAPSHDGLFYFIYWLCVVSFVGLMATMTYFVVRYRRRSPDQRTSPLSGSLRLEIVWSIIPAIFLAIVFAWGLKGFVQYQSVPSNAIDIRVVGYKWFWEYRYANGTTLTNDLIVPVNTPVRLIMSSEATSADDPAVLHSFFVPAFRVKRDVLPYRYTVMWFEATQTGEFDVFCTEYCGAGHSKMIGRVIVVEQDEYEDALAPQPWDENVETLAQFGERTFQSNGCTACHSIDGSRMVGPSMAGLYGASRPITGEGQVTADENYLRESIVNPGARIVESYPNAMPTFAGRLTDQQIDGIIAYIQSLQ